MPDILSMSEIEKRYDGEWVLLDELQHGAHQSITAAHVLFHSKDRDELDRKALELRPPHCAVLYIGRRTNRAIIL